MRFTWHDDSLGRVSVRLTFNTLRPRQNGRHFADNTFKPIFLNENIRILIKISLKFVPKVPINNIPALVQIMAWRRPGDKPLSEPMMINLLTHICVTRPQWVNLISPQTNMVMTSHFTHLPPGQNGHHFEDGIFTHIVVNDQFCILIIKSLKFVPKGPIDNNPALV